MNGRYYLLVVSMIGSFFDISAMEVSATTRTKMKLACITATSDSLMSSLANRLQTACAFSGQFQIDVHQMPSEMSKKKMQELYAHGYPLVLLLTKMSDDLVEWRLYDTLKAQMVAGKKCARDGNDTNWWALHVAHSFWPELTGTEGFFLSKIAYSKHIPAARGKSFKHICISDFDGAHEQVVVATPTINIVPRWNHDLVNPLLFYSEYTNRNVRMMMVDTNKRRRIASNFEGINMLTTFSADGKKVVYCASRGDGNCQMYYHENGVFKRLIYTDRQSGKSLTDGNNISPTMSFSGDTVYFCSDFQTHLPQVYAYDIATNHVTKLTDGGYCASPCYCHKTGKLAYTKKINGIMQVYVCDLVTKSHAQITFDGASKDECSWSPCGNYIAVSAEADGINRIAVYSMLTKQLSYITPPGVDCSYPSWSPLYPMFLVS